MAKSIFDLGVSVVNFPARDLSFTEDPMSALIEFEHARITPASWHSMRCQLERWYSWRAEQHDGCTPRPHYWFIEMHRSAAKIELHEPYYQHDCDQCQYLGAFIDEHNLLHDLYHCTKGPGETFIARYGDEGREYRSGFALVGLDPAITEAARRYMNDPRDFIFSY